MTLLGGLHLLGWVISFGTGFYVAFILYPSLRVIEDPSLKMKVLAASLQRFHPFYLLGISVSFMTGAFMLTQLKISMGGGYFDRMLAPLGWKFLMVLLVFNLAAMQCFGQGLKLYRMAFGVIPGDLPTMERYACKIHRTQIINLAFILITVYFGYGLRAVL